MQRNFRQNALAAVCMTVGLTVWGCGGLVETTNNPPAPSNFPTPVAPVTNPRFDPAAGNPALIPLPNDLLRNPQTGFIDQLPNTPQFQAEPFAALRSLRGFSTAGNIVIPFAGGVIPTSVDNNSIRIIDTTNNQTINATFTVQRPFVAGTPVDSVVIAQPQLPLNPLRTYVVVILPNVQGSGGNVQPTALINLLKSATPLVDAQGNSLVTGVSNAQAQALEPLRLFYQPIWARAEAVLGIPRAQIPFAFQFGTQPLFAPLQGLRARAEQENRPLVNGFVAAGAGNVTGLSVPAFFALNNITGVPSASIGRIVVGNISVPNYVGNVLTGFFQGSGLSAQDPIVSQGNLTIPFFATLPANPAPGVIFQHGITSRKEDLLAIANASNGAGYGVVGIDLPLHGNQSVPGVPPTALINLGNLRNARDNLRQSAVNLFYLSQVIRSGQFTVLTNTGPQTVITNNTIGFLGHSFGSLVGLPAVTVDPNINLALFAVPGGRLTNLLLNSNQFAPATLAALANLGVIPGTDAFTQFFLIAQTVLDDADAFNYAPHLLTGALRPAGRQAPPRVLIQQAIGDTVVPQEATVDLANAINRDAPLLSQVAPAILRLPRLPLVNPPFAGSGLSQFNNAIHSFLLSPNPLIASAQTQMATFFATGFFQNNAVIIAP